MLKTQANVGVVFRATEETYETSWYKIVSKEPNGSITCVNLYNDNEYTFKKAEFETFKLASSEPVVGDMSFFYGKEVKVTYPWGDTAGVVTHGVYEHIWLQGVAHKRIQQVFIDGQGYNITDSTKISLVS